VLRSDGYLKERCAGFSFKYIHSMRRFLNDFRPNVLMLWYVRRYEKVAQCIIISGLVDAVSYVCMCFDTTLRVVVANAIIISLCSGGI
jgi:hypothetical protein